MKEIFTSDRYFCVWDFYISHAQMLIRSERIKNGQKYNIDIIFFSTTYIQVYRMLYGLTLREVSKENFNKDNLNRYNSVDTWLSYDETKLFEITSGNEKYYIAAGFVIVCENELDFDETSLGMVHVGRERVIARS